MRVSLVFVRKYSRTSNQLSITDPYIIYQSYVARGILKSDHQQLRIAKEFQKLYYRVKDYVPEQDTQNRIKDLIKKLEIKNASSDTPRRWFYKPNNSTTDVIKILTDEEELKNFPSPHGLLINGDVGSGKSMLLDIFADSLPHHAKVRWHHSNFMLWIYNEIHTIYQKRLTINKNGVKVSLDNEFILFEIANKMIKMNTILLIDEFMLPDLATAKIVKLVFTYFFKLGGVLVATSNRLPEDLYATDFRKKEFTQFLNILQSRCHSLNMNSVNDYRYILSSDDSVQSHLLVGSNVDEFNSIVSKNEPKLKLNEENSSSLKVYGREIEIPFYCSKTNTVKFTFKEICENLYASGDYISLASNYETFIITDVPVLKVNMKNEARRFINLIDALYECKCELFIQIEAPLDQLFFPDSKTSKFEEDEANRIRVADEEMFSKTQIALTTPYRPNVSYYDDEKIVYKEGDLSNIRDFDLSVDNNFTNSKAFTGEDERFAYKRAVSRLKEITDSLNYRNTKWKPINKLMRPWESTKISVNQEKQNLDNDINPINGRYYNNANEGLFAPVFKNVHFWSLGLWGKGERLKDEIAKKWIKGNE